MWRSHSHRQSCRPAGNWWTSGQHLVLHDLKTKTSVTISLFLNKIMSKISQRTKAVEGLASLDPTAAGELEALGGGPVGFHLVAHLLASL